MLPCLALVVAVLASAASPPPPSHTLTATMANRIDDLGRRQIAQHRAPGLAVAIVEDGRIVYARGFGYADLNAHRHVVPETQFYAGGVGMPFAAAALLLLEQQGKLKLDDRVTKYVPELTVAGNATIDQLLHQTSGLPDLAQAPGFRIDRSHTAKLADIIAAVDKLQPSFAPGTKVETNDLNYMIAGLIVERASGLPLSDYLQQNIFIPLVMNATFSAGDRGISSQRAVGYTGGQEKFRKADVWDPAWLYGGNALVTNVYDLAKWDIGFPLLLRVDAERAMFTASSANSPLQFGLGWMIDQREGKRYIWQSGQISGFQAMNALLPDDNIAVIVLENTDALHAHSVAMPQTLAAQVLDIILPPAGVSMNNAVMEKAREWLQRLAEGHIDRTQLTPSFSRYLSDTLVERSNFAALGKPQTLIPVDSIAAANGATVYEFLVRFARDEYYYKLTLAQDGKIDGLYLSQDL